jgi:hypothetical protein
MTFNTPSVELFQEWVWDRLEPMKMTDEEVRDVAIWSGHKFLGYSLSSSGEAWGLTKKQAECVVKRLDRNVTEDLLTAAVLATAVPIPVDK